MTVDLQRRRVHQNPSPSSRPPLGSLAMAPLLHPDASQHEILAVLARTLPVRRYLEVGVQEGCSLWVVHEAAKRTLRHVALCDDWGREAGGSGRGDHDHITHMMRGLGYRGELFYLDGQSQDRVPSLRERRPEYRAELIHIDGDHRHPAVLEDLRNCWPICTGAMVTLGHVHRCAEVVCRIEYSLIIGCDQDIRRVAFLTPLVDVLQHRLACNLAQRLAGEALGCVSCGNYDNKV